MELETRFVYRKQPLDRFSTIEKIKILGADLAFTGLIRLIGLTLRFECEGEENLRRAESSGPVIFSIWHNRIFGGIYYLRNRRIAVMTSESFDGEYIARFITRFGFGAVRGSSTRGGVRALVQMARLMRKDVPMAFTVDGPRGPKYKVKPGPILLARKTGRPIIPLSFEYRNRLELGSWDQMQIPLPFSRVRAYFAEPIFVPYEADEVAAEAKLKELQQSLDKLVEIGKKWRVS
ncbi:MAG: hypothetical protein C4325_08940 [Blastocatellia bacterium]